MVKIVHPDGEKAQAEGCKKTGIAQSISTNASFPMSEVLSPVPGVPFSFQLYVNKERENSEVLLWQAKQLGFRAIIVTVDAPVAGKREADERVKADEGL